MNAVNFTGGLPILLLVMKMKCLKPKTQKHRTNIVKYACLYQGNSPLYIRLKDENYFSAAAASVM
jgi:hypothetical protein